MAPPCKVALYGSTFFSVEDVNAKHTINFIWPDNENLRGVISKIRAKWGMVIMGDTL